jgi:hypothetical protein
MSGKIDGWQTIETAPRDRRVVVWTGREKYIAHWAKNPFTDDEAWIVANFGDDGDQLLVKPVLWAEAPADPPADGAARGTGDDWCVEGPDLVSAALVERDM